MKISFNKIIPLFLLLGFRADPAAHDLTLKIKVHGNDQNLTGRISEDLKNNLENKSHIIVVPETTDSAAFTITVQFATLKSGDKLIGFFMNSLLTRRIRTSKDESADVLLKSSVSSTANPADIEKFCTSLTDQYDAQYFEKEKGQ